MTLLILIILKSNLAMHDNGHAIAQETNLKLIIKLDQRKLTSVDKLWEYLNNKFTTLPIITFISLFKEELIGGVFTIFLFAMGERNGTPS
jgi:hypothetical protein